MSIARRALTPESVGEEPGVSLTPVQRELVAAYLTDRADQYDTESPCWIALTDAAEDVINGEVEAAARNGDLDEDLRRRVRKWKRKPEPTKGETR